MSSDSSKRPPTLLLVPTTAELDYFAAQDGLEALAARIEICGFGPIAAAARAAQLIADYTPQSVLLAGIAGSYEPGQLGVAEAVCFREVAVYGIGAGSLTDFTPASQMGFAQWPGQTLGQRKSIEESIQLAVPPTVPTADLLLTCCAASASSVDIENRLARFPRAAAEDMEGFGVAISCQLADVPLTVIRGISNQVGDRHRSRWKIRESLEAVWQLVKQVLAEGMDRETAT